VVPKRESARVAELDVIEDVECLDAKLHRNSLRQLSLFDQREVDLPTVQSTNQSIRCVSKTGEEAVRVHRRGCECGGIDQRYAIVPTPRKSHWHARDHVRPLIGLIVTIGKKISARQTGWEERIERILNVVAEVHLHGQGMASVPQADA